jgi:hypothetical protein
MFEKEVMEQVRASVSKAVYETLSGYGSPFRKCIEQSAEAYYPHVRELIAGAINSLVMDEQFKQQMVDGIRHKVAKELVASFGEGIFKQSIDKLKADPTIRAKCIIAVEGLLK